MIFPVTAGSLRLHPHETKAPLPQKRWEGFSLCIVIRKAETSSVSYLNCNDI